MPAAFVFARLDPRAVLEHQQADRGAARYQHVLLARIGLGSARTDFPWCGFGRHVVCPFRFSIGASHCGPLPRSTTARTGRIVKSEVESKLSARLHSRAGNV